MCVAVSDYYSLQECIQCPFSTAPCMVLCIKVFDIQRIHSFMDNWIQQQNKTKKSVQQQYMCIITCREEGIVEILLYYVIT